MTFCSHFINLMLLLMMIGVNCAYTIFIVESAERVGIFYELTQDKTTYFLYILVPLIVINLVSRSGRIRCK